MKNKFFQKLSIAFLSLILSSSQLFAAEELVDKTSKIIDDQVHDLFKTYKEFHQTPELSLYEKNTSKKLAFALKKLGFEVKENFGGYGVVGIFKNGKGKTVLVRTDMDA